MSLVSLEFQQKAVKNLFANEKRDAHSGLCLAALPMIVKDNFQTTEIHHVDVEFGARRRHADSRVCGVAHVKPRRYTLCVGDNRIFQPEIRRRTDSGNRVFAGGILLRYDDGVLRRTVGLLLKRGKRVVAGLKVGYFAGRNFPCRGVFGDLFREIGAPGNRFGIFSGYVLSYDAVFNCVNTS
jgi:hypothetical protein